MIVQIMIPLLGNALYAKPQAEVDKESHATADAGDTEEKDEESQETESPK